MLSMRFRKLPPSMVWNSIREWQEVLLRNC
jgi:hypothetical protein